MPMAVGEKKLQRVSSSRGGRGHGTDRGVASMSREVHLQKSECAELQGTGRPVGEGGQGAGIGGKVSS